jgi:hypothetical protein
MENKDKIVSTVNFIRKVYLMLILLGIIGSCEIISDVINKQNVGQNVAILISIIIDIVIHYGLKHWKKWVVPLIIFASTLSIIHLTVSTASGAVASQNTNIFSLTISYVMIIAMLFFYSFQIYFFTKKEVKIFWGIKGQIGMALT